MKLIRKLALSNYIIWLLMILLVTPIVWIIYVLCVITEIIKYIPVIVKDYMWFSTFDAMSYQHYKEQKKMDSEIWLDL